MSEGFYDIESQQMSMPQSISRFKSHFSTLKTTVVNYHKCLFISGFIFIATFIAIYQHNQIESETEEFDFSAFALKSDDPMTTRNLLSASNDITITVATFNLGGPNASPFEYEPSEAEEWYSTFEEINDYIRDELWESTETISSILHNDKRVIEMINSNSSIAGLVTKPIAQIMKDAYTPIQPKDETYESRIFSILGRLDRFTWLKQDAKKYPTGDECRKDLIENGAQWQYEVWNQKWEDKWKVLKNDDEKKFDSNKFLENSGLLKFTGNSDDLRKKFAIIMLKTFDRICWDAAVMAFQNGQSQDPNPVSVMFKTAFKGGDDILEKEKIPLLRAVTDIHHVTFVHEGMNLTQLFPTEFPKDKYYIVQSESKVNTPSLIIFNKKKFDKFQESDKIIGLEIPEPQQPDSAKGSTKKQLNNEFVAVKYYDEQYGNINFASFHAASSPKEPNRAIDKMEFLKKNGFPVIAGMDCNDEIFKKKGGYSGSAYPAPSESMTTHKKRRHIQEQQGKADELDSKQKDEIFYQKVEMVKGSSSVLTKGEQALRPINPNPEEEDTIPNRNMPIDHFIVSAEFKITKKQ